MLNKSKFLELQRRQHESGLTVKEFCINEGLAPYSNHYWKKKLSKSNRSKQEFIPSIAKNNHAVSAQNFSSLAQSRETDALLELIYPNGTRLRIKQDLDLTQLRSLINLFD